MQADYAVTVRPVRRAHPGGAMARDFNAVWEQLWRQDHVPPRLLELCRCGWRGCTAPAPRRAACAASSAIRDRIEAS
jgi:hypothetical protein